MCDHKSDHMPRYVSCNGKGLEREREGKVQRGHMRHEGLLGFTNREGVQEQPAEQDCALLSWTGRELLI